MTEVHENDLGIDKMFHVMTKVIAWLYMFIKSHLVIHLELVTCR